MKRNAIAIATAAICAVGFSSFAHAQVSGDTIKIGFISDMSGVYSDVDGLGGAEAIKMAIADAGVVLAGKKVEFISADHQNKADIAASKAREWFDQQGVDIHADVHDLGVERRVLVGDVGVERPSWAAAVLRVDVPRALGLAAGSEILAVRR